MSPSRIAIRCRDSNRAILLVHGFSGSAESTFGLLPAFLAADDELESWDIWSIGYPTALRPDFTGVWSADPDLASLSRYLADDLNSRVHKDQSIVLVGHSMGGLIVQRAVLCDSVMSRTHAVVLYGTPSAGLRKAGLGRLFKRQARDMFPCSQFLKELRSKWAARFRGGAPFRFLSIAGLEDEFVPSSSSLGPFELPYQSWVPGNHLQMVKPRSADSATVRRLIDLVTDSRGGIGTPQLDDSNSPSEELHPKQLVSAALRLEMAGQVDRAIEMLREHRDKNYYVAGALAGRLKRQWLADPDNTTELFQEALQTYKLAFEGSLRAEAFNQAAYTGINTAFMILAGNEGCASNALDVARKARRAKAQANRAGRRDKWAKIVEAEAALHERDFPFAVEVYRDAWQYLDSREFVSALRQAIYVCRLVGAEHAADQLTSFHQTIT